MTIGLLLAAALLAPAAAFAQGWGSEGNDPNRGTVSASAPAAAPAPAPSAKAAPKVKAKAAARAESDDSGLDDAALDRSRALVDRQLAARKGSLAAQTQRLEGYHLAMEKDSMDAERQMSEERKAFLLYLKSVPQEDRPAAMKAFEGRQEGKRKDLDKRHLSQYKAWFEESIASNWRTQPLAAEQVSAPAPAVAQAPEAPAPAAAAAPAAKPTVARAKVKKRRKQ